MMKRKLLRILVLTLIVSALAITISAPTFAKTFEGDGWQVTKISNPDRGEREVDGLVAGGDRENSYTWRMASRGDYIYIATTRNIASALVNLYGEQIEQAGGGVTLDSLWAVIDVITNGDIYRNPVSEGANIISYNRKTGEFKVIYTDDNRSYFRMAVTFGDDVYFGSYSAYPDVPQYILKLDTEGNFTKVFETMGSVSLRANCVYDDHLFFAGADDRETVEPEEGNPTKMAILRKSNEDDTDWERVADFRDFGDIAYDSIMSSWAGAPVWELTNHNGYIYATAPSTEGFVIFKGHPAVTGEQANEYGWCWTEVAGLNNGINNPGLSDKVGGEPGTMRSLIGSTFEFKGDLYAYNFDHAFGGEAKAFVGVLQQIAGKGVKASEYLSYMYDSLHNPQKLWKLNDETGKFEECKGFTELTKGTTNEYVWRAGEYDGQMYIATMDAKVFYGYLTQLTTTDFSDLTFDQIQSRITYIKRLISLIVGSKMAESVDVGQLTKTLKLESSMFERLKGMSIDQESVNAFLEAYGDVDEELDDASAGVDNELKGNSLEQLVDDAMTDENLRSVSAGDLTLEELVLGCEDENGVIPDDISNKYNAKFRRAVDSALQDNESVNELTATQYKLLKAKTRLIIGEYIAAFIKNALEELKADFEKVDWKGFQMYRYISRTVKKDKGGFDLFRTADAENFEVITRTGFDDKYNYGCSSFLATEEGLYIGTCNPFYGGQLYLLQTGIEKEYKGAEADKGTKPALTVKTTIKVTNKSKIFKASRLVKRAKYFKLKAIISSGAKATFTKESGSSKLIVTKAGKIKVVKGTKKGTYKALVKVSAPSRIIFGKKFKEKTKFVTVLVKVK